MQATFFILNKIKPLKFLLIILILAGFQACDITRTPEKFNPVRFMYDQNSWRSRPFDRAWKFHRGDAEGAEDPAYDDSHWRLLDLPHDWSVEDIPQFADSFPPTDPPAAGPFSPASPGGLSTGFTLGGIGWYRKAFSLDTDDIDKRIYVRFDGVYMNADFWINGHHLGNHPYGYTSFSYDLTPYLKPADEENILAVEVKNTGKNSRWYSGSGLYRHVWLDVVNPVHIETWGLFITTPEVSEESATVTLTSNVLNLRDTVVNITVETQIIDPDQQESDFYRASSKIMSGEHKAVDQEITITDPLLWSPDTPELYLAEVTVIVDEVPVDRLLSTFGIRSINFDAESGFTLNGEPILLKGGNLHHDNGPLGAKTIDRAEYRRVKTMKSFGYNAIRTSHNPPSPQFLDACDHYGILVMDEAFDQWQEPKNPEDYNLYFEEWWKRDLESMVLRDRNHPSVIMWSIGNEIRERADSSGLVIAGKMKNVIEALDDTRPVTQAICNFWDHPGRPWEDTYPAFRILDVQGYNYQWQRYEEDHEKFPQWIIAGTESVAKEAYEYWNQVEVHPYVIGDFLWTGMDYLGEASIGHAVLNKETEGNLLSWPWFNAWCGDVDICGFKKPQSYYRDVVWGRSRIEMQVHTPVPESKEEHVSFWGWPDQWPSWNWPGEEDNPLRVAVFSDCEEVRLELNGRSLGTKPVSEDSALTVHFTVPYEPGTLRAVGLEHGAEVDSVILETTGEPARIRLTPERNPIQADRNDLAYVRIDIVDLEGRRVPAAEVNIRFTISGAGELAAVGNGNPRDLKSFQSPVVKTFRGRALVIIHPDADPGTILLTADAECLESTPVEIRTH